MKPGWYAGEWRNVGEGYDVSHLHILSVPRTSNFQPHTADNLNSLTFANDSVMIPHLLLQLVFQCW